MLGLTCVLCAGAETNLQFSATVTMIDGDVTPAATPGPGNIDGGIVGLDYNYRSIFIALEEERVIGSVVLKSNPSTRDAKTGNENLTADKLELYSSNDNASFQKVNFKYRAPDNDTIILDGFQVKTKYLKIHATCDKASNYKFVNHLRKMVPAFVLPPAKWKQEQGEGRPYLGAGTDSSSLEQTYYEVEDPLFKTLLGDVPAPKHVLVWAGNCDDEIGRYRPAFRAYAKKFGYRYVFEEQLEETAGHNMLYQGKMTPWLETHGIGTWRGIIGDPGEAFVPSLEGMPMIFGAQGWLMDPRWQKEYVRLAVERAKAKEQWALFAGDEVWESFAINVVPKDKRYDEVMVADREIREKYGFGKYGMPDSDDDPNPFARIAHRRWVSDTLTQLYKKTWQEVKKVNPDTVMMAPDFAGGVPAADIEAWAPYFDIFTAQCSISPSPFVARFCVGCDTKVLADLSGKPAWMAVQNATTIDLGYTATPEYIREMYSQVFRNGGQGIFLLAAEWYERELNHPKNAEPAKWRALLHVVDTITHMNLPTLPKADCAILYSSDSLLTLRWAQLNNGNWELYSAYTALGPLLRSWFHVVSDRQIERGIRRLDDYKVLYVPFAKYERGSVLDKIESYVKNGGTVVCTDPEAFTWDVNGESLAQKWEKLTGVRKEGPKKGDPAMRTVSPNPLPLEEQLSFTALVAGWQIASADNTVQSLAVFADGSPAITRHPYGKGTVIFFAADPFAIPGGWKAAQSLVQPSSPVVTFVQAIQKDVRARMGHDIWRFKLPPFPSNLYENEKDLCLTGNYVIDRNEPLRAANNIETGGTYAYSRSPTGINDRGNEGVPVPFAQGKLTDRIAAYQGRRLGDDWHLDYAKLSEVPNKWIVSWTDAAPVTITFDLKKDHPLKKLKLIYSATLPALTVSGSLDGNEWRQLASVSAESAGQDVKDVTVPLEGNYRHVKLDVAARPERDMFELAEVEIWGRQPK